MSQEENAVPEAISRAHAGEAPMSLREASQLRILDPASVRAFRHGANLRVELPGERCVPRAEVVRVYPLSDPDRWFSLREVEGDEIGALETFEGVDPGTRALLEEFLSRRYFLPVLRRVIRTKELFGVVNWEVETDRGPRRFTTRNLRESLVRPSAVRLLLTDVDGNRYDIRDLEALDAESQSLVLAQI